MHEGVCAVLTTKRKGEQEEARGFGLSLSMTSEKHLVSKVRPTHLVCPPQSRCSRSRLLLSLAPDWPGSAIIPNDKDKIMGTNFCRRLCYNICSIQQISLDENNLSRDVHTHFLKILKHVIFYFKLQLHFRFRCYVCRLPGHSG